MKQDESITETIYTSTEVIAPGEIIIGTLVKFSDQGEPCVNFSENPSSSDLQAISTLSLTKKHVGKQVALLFSNGDINLPVIMGIIHNPLQDMLENFDQSDADTNARNENRHTEEPIKVDDVLIDGNKITFNAKEQIVLKCGESSITLTKAGKILIRGKYLLNRSTGVNRIMGGSVQVN